MSVSTAQGQLKLYFSPSFLGWVLCLGKAFLGVFPDKEVGLAHFYEVRGMLQDEEQDRWEYHNQFT